MSALKTVENKPVSAPAPAVTPAPVAARPAPSAPPRAPAQAAPAPTASGLGQQAQQQQPPSPPPAPAQNPTTTASGGQVSQATPVKQYVGHPISMDFQGVDLRSVLRTFAEISGLNMVIDPDVQGSVDIVLTDVPWDQALDVILRGNGLDYTVDGTIVRIARVDTLKKEQDARTQLATSNANAGALVVRTYTLSYARAELTAPLVRSAVLSPRGSIQIDQRTNTLIITDLGPRHETVQTLLGTLDRPEPQVEVEARVVQTTREFARAIGIQWGLNGRVAPELGNTTGLAFPNRGSLSGRTGNVNTPADPRATDFESTGTAVNLGVPGATAAVGLALGSVNGAFNLDVALSALERSGKGRVLSTPRLTTQNNIEAEVAQGVQIPIQVVANNTITVTFKEAVLLLKVTPQITSAGTVIMRITIENAAADFSRQVLGIPPIDTQRAITQVQVNDGATTVIGGIFVSREQSSNERTPLLHRIPLLGWLFKRDTTTDESRELLIFITPRILKG
jgi:type IV pilus assembly protein PilQ